MALIDRQSQTLKTVSQLVVDVNKMAPYVPEEVNVFSVPHSRMKELVNSYFTLVGRWGCLFILWKSLRAMYYLFATPTRYDNRVPGTGMVPGMVNK